MPIASTFRVAWKKISLALLLAGGFLCHPSESRNAEPLRDGLGDPLPAGAVARLGSTRLWHEGTESVYLSPDGKTVATLSIGFGHGRLLPARTCKWDVATGRLLQETPLPRYTGYSYNLSPDGKFLARYIDEGKEQRMVIWDLEQEKEIQGPLRDSAHSITFRTVLADRKTVVYRDNEDHHLYFWDVAARKSVKRSGPLAPRGMQCEINDAVVSGNGKRVVWFLSRAGKEVLQVVDEGREKPILERDVQLVRGFDNAILSPDGEHLAWKSDWNAVRILDLPDTENHVVVPNGSFDHLVFSPNGKLLACVQRYRSGARVLKVLDVAKKRFSANFSVSSSRRGWRTAVGFSRDGKSLAVSADGATRVYDIASGKERLHTAGHRASVNQLHFTRDGLRLISRDGAVVCRWQREPGKRFRMRPSPRIQPCLERDELLWDGKAPPGKGDDVYSRQKLNRPGYALDATVKVNPGGIVLDMAGFLPRKISQLQLDTDGGYRGNYVSPDNRRVLLYREGRGRPDGGEFEIFDVATGKRLARWPGPDPLTAVFSPDSRLFVWQGREHGKLLLGDPQSAAMKKTLSTDLSRKPFREAYFVGSNAPDPARHTWLFDRMAVSPDNHRVAAAWNSSLAVSAHPLQFTRDQDREPTTLYVWDAARGKEIARVVFKGPKGKMPQVTCLAFLRDGRTLAAGYLHDTRVHLIEIASGRERAALPGHRGTVRSLALSPEGRHLLSGSDDTTILVWDLHSLPSTSSRPVKTPLSATECTQLREDLASTDAAVAFRAIEILRRCPEQAVPLLGKHLQPVADVKPEQIQRWIKELDSDTFAERQRATTQLENLGDLAEPALRSALRKRPPLEVRLRLRRLLEMVENFAQPPQRLRQIRAVEVLETIGNAPAREHLKRLANGARRARLTHEASSSLRRLSLR